MRRIFVVGCPRSGTTLLQTILMASGRLASYPETHFFENYRYLSDWPLPTGVRGYLMVRRLFRGQNVRTRFGVTRRSGVNAYISALDQLAEAEEQQGWIEKTPDNLQFVEFIDRYVENAEFIHIMRNARDVIASLYSASRDWDSPLSAEQCLEKWLIGIGWSAGALNQANHHAVRYEELVADPALVVDGLARAIGMDLALPNDLDLASKARSVVAPEETWKENNLAFKQPTKIPSKFGQVFDTTTRKYMDDFLDMTQSLTKREND